MERVLLSCVFLLVATYPGGMEVAAQDVVLERIEPDSGQLPCPNQGVMYQCRVLVPSLGLTWTLPNGDGTLQFSIVSNEGDVRPIPPDDGVYTATLTNKTEDDDPGTDLLSFTSTLLILETVNGTLTCSGANGTSTVENSTDIIVSGVPDPPSGLDYDDTVVIKSSVTLQWTRPSYTGGMGVSLMSYSVSANGQTWPVSDMGEMVSYTTPRLVYGEVQVTAINSCGQQSLTTSINIPAKEPPKISNFSLDFSCNVAFKNVPVKVNWMYESRRKGVVYPGDMRVSVEMFPAGVFCLNEFTQDTSCTVEITRNNLSRITITQSNDVGSTVNEFSMIDISVLLVEEQILRLDTPVLIVTVRRNSECPETSSPVLVTFGARPANGGECVGQKNATSTPIPSGASASFFVNADSISLGQDDIYCFIVILDGVPVASGAGASGVRTVNTTDGSSALSAGAAAGIAVAATFLATLPVGVALGCCGMWFLMRSQGKRALHGNQEKREKRELVAVYDDPDRMKTEFSVSNNQAYGQISTTAQ